MQANPSRAQSVNAANGLAPGAAGGLVLGVDTCGPSGSVALGRLTAEKLQILGQIELAGRSYSATLVAAVAELLGEVGVGPRELACIVAVHGPGSFTGVRVGLSAVKGLAEPGGICVVVVSRLAVLAHKAGTQSAALDAHRHEVFLRIGGAGAKTREVLASAGDLTAIPDPPAEIALCDDAAAEVILAAWPAVRLIRVEAPSAADAVDLARAQIAAGEFIDLALLDGHYLRRSDAEIFGEPASAASSQRA
jgi:tRNA threonylcarbamoyladenosine biosynthesis protein TsaB